MIQWTRLMKVIKSVLNESGINANVRLHLTTNMPDEIRANVQGKDGSYDILLSAGDNKCIEDVLESVGHELAHIVLNSNGHDSVTQVELVRKLKEGMNVSVR